MRTLPDEHPDDFSPVPPGDIERPTGPNHERFVGVQMGQATVKTCRHTSGFTNITPVDPEPGTPPTLAEATCLGPCGEIRYLDVHGYIYRSEEDFAAGKPERRIGQ